VGEGLLSLIPHLIKQAVAGWWLCVGVAGWNISLLVRTASALCGGGGLGTLLGPEETPDCFGVFLVPLLALSV
jgi:hypothetical protein